MYVILNLIQFGSRFVLLFISHGSEGSETMLQVINYVKKINSKLLYFKSNVFIGDFTLYKYLQVTFFNTYDNNNKFNYINYINLNVCCCKIIVIINCY